MRLLLDECISHSFVARLAARGYPDSIHPINVGMRGRRDDEIVSRALRDDRIIVTSNASDYRDLFSREIIHPGLIILPNAELEHSWRLLELALTFIELHEHPADYMVNLVIELSLDEGIRPYELPRSAAD